jgi:hypothetical protein
MFGFGRRSVERLEFIVAGVQKAGTTALNYYLKGHPRIALPVKKELHFFDNDELFESGAASYHQLHEMFRPVRPGSIAGENTPSYLYWKTALPRIRDYNPAIKLIAILRNPIERAFSQWNMQRHRGLEPLDFTEALAAERQRLVQVEPTQFRKFAYLGRSRYAEQLERAFTNFPSSQLLILKYEEFRAHQGELVAQVFRFLGLEPPRFRRVEAHDIPYRRKLRSEERAAAFELLRDDIRIVEQLLGWNCSDWR